MKSVVPDASALAALVFGEAESDLVRGRLEGAELFAPALLKFEIASVAWKKVRRHPELIGDVLARLDDVLGGQWEIGWREVDHADAVLIARALGISTYDASYVWLAGSLGADLVTLDQKLVEATARLAV